MQKVILVGGSPRVGKSTVGALLSAKLGFPCLSTDDIGEVLQTVCDINPMRGYEYPEYYARREKQQLIDDIAAYHRKLEPAIARLVEIHSSWGDPLILEGWALYPELVRRLENDQVFSVWLIAQEGLLAQRVRTSTSFYALAKEPEKVIENYLHRSLWHNQKLLAQCKAQNRNYILVGENTAAEETAEKILAML